MICSKVLPFVHNQHQHNHLTIFCRVNKAVTLFFQFDFVAIMKVSTQA